MNKKKKIIIAIVILLLLASLIFMALNFLSGGILAEAIFDRPNKPKIKNAEFPFTLVYEYKGEQFTIEESVVCKYKGIYFSLEGGNERDWDCYVTNNDNNGRYYLDEKQYPTLYVQVPLNADYLMGMEDTDPAYKNPYIFFVEESSGTTYYEEKEIESVEAKIISWKISEPMKDNF